jgi:putative hydrolase of the HAD superfamily
VPDTAGSLDGLLIALDVDGVLLDSDRAGAGPWQLVVAERFNVKPDDLQRHFFDPYWSEVIVGRRPIEPALAATIAERSWPVTVEALLACWFESDFCPAPEVVDAARSWRDRGARLALVTNQEHRRAHDLQERLGDLLPFDQMVYSAAVGYVKRQPEFFAVATRSLAGGSTAPCPVVFLDDTLEHVTVAQAAGWTAVHFETGAWRGPMEAVLESASSARRP